MANDATELTATAGRLPVRRLEPMPDTALQPFATTMFEAYDSPVRTRRLQPPDLSWIRRILWPAIDHFVSDQGFVLAGYISFTSLFALFPFLIFLLAFAGFLGETEAARQSITLGLDFLPEEVASVLKPVINEVMAAPHGTLMTFSITLTLWFASSGLESLRHALNLAFGVTDPPAFWANRLGSIGITIGASALIIGAMLLLIAFPVSVDVLGWLSTWEGFGKTYNFDVYPLARYSAGVMMILTMTVGLYLVLPNVRLRLPEVLPGAVISVVIWIGTTILYSVYLRSFGRYNVLYGSLGGVIFTMFYFNLSAVIFIFGAQINAAIRKQHMS